LRARLGKVDDARGPVVGATLVATGSSLPYVIVREVARGGAGVVYEARERIADVERTIALKMAHVRQSMRTQLGHEARIAVRFRGRGVVPILDIDSAAGWLAMAWAPGGSLRARLAAAKPSESGLRNARSDDPLSRDARAWLRPLIETLDEVHRAGWVHGDVKPANVLFDASDAPMLGDFGLARACGEPNTPGSAGYVPQERATGSPCAPSDDVFGIGKLILDVVAVGWADDRLRALAERCTAPIDTRPHDFSQILRDL
jgi:serine/threonine-protein kinase